MKKNIPLLFITAVGIILTAIGILDKSVALAVIGVAMVAASWINKSTWFK